MKKCKYLLTCAVLILLQVGCASFLPDFEPPEVKLVSFKPLPVEGLEQRFQIGLRILNHNSSDLHINGISYFFSLNDYKVFSGVSNNVPDIAAYSDGLVTLQGSANLIGGGRFMVDLLQGNSSQITYELQTKIDVGTFLPAIRVVESGQLDDIR